MISTRDLSRSPDVDELRRTLQAMAMLDAILCPEWEFRYHSFNADWADGEQMGSMRNGSGDDFFAHFGSAGCWLKGFAHESLMSPYQKSPPHPWPGVLDAVPGEFAACLREPAFRMDDVTFCIWRSYGDPNWQVGPVQPPTDVSDPDGSEDLLSPLDGQSTTYHEWAESYYERVIELVAVEHVYRHLPLTSDLIDRLNPQLTLDALSGDIHEIGYGRDGRLSLRERT